LLLSAGATPGAAGVAFLGKLPQTCSGKIERRLLKAQELGQKVSEFSTPEQQAELRFN
jgi:acyl-coenzyme A synthetase/AMP-(fatty) acid ligase